MDRVVYGLPGPRPREVPALRRAGGRRLRQGRDREGRNTLRIQALRDLSIQALRDLSIQALRGLSISALRETIGSRPEEPAILFRKSGSAGGGSCPERRAKRHSCPCRRRLPKKVSEEGFRRRFPKKASEEVFRGRLPRLAFALRFHALFVQGPPGMKRRGRNKAAYADVSAAGLPRPEAGRRALRRRAPCGKPRGPSRRPSGADYRGGFPGAGLRPARGLRQAGFAAAAGQGAPERGPALAPRPFAPS